MAETITLKPYPYSLDFECPVPWPSQESTINQEYPFHCIDEESPYDFLVRRYLETLWLPESIMPLHQLVKSLRRFMPSTFISQALYATLNPLLLSVRAIHDKYHNQLPQILQDGGGAGEIEETMMWYSWNREKPQLDATGEDIGKKAWMEKLERREVQIQILLYFHLLSLPSQTPVVPLSPKKRRKLTHGPPSPIKYVFPPTASVEATTVNVATSSFKLSTTDIDENLGIEDRLEFLMDRLSLWQLMNSLTPSGPSATASKTNPKDQRDWMQIFCEDVVEQLFRDHVPEMCDLLRTKVFPHRLFSDSSDTALSPPPIRPTKKSKSKSTRPPSPLRIQELEKPQASRSRAGSIQPPLTPTDSRGSVVSQRRSRSRSVSVSVEEVRARGANRGGVASSKRLWKGEVEMKRTSSRGSKLFKPTPRDNQYDDLGKTTHQKSQGDILPSGAPSRVSEPRSPSQARDARLLAADTPVKKTIKEEDAMPNIIMDSPDELLFRNNRQWHDLDEIDEEGALIPPTPIFAADTPVKKYVYR